MTEVERRVLRFLPSNLIAQEIASGDHKDHAIPAHPLTVHRVPMSMVPDHGASIPKGQWLVQTDVTDPERHAEYVKASRPVFGRYGARILVRWGQHQVVEGVARSGLVVFEFPDCASALACYYDPDYEAAQKLCVGAADGDVVILEGYDGVQPADRTVRSGARS